MAGKAAIGYQAEGPGDEEHDHQLWKIICLVYPLTLFAHR